MPAYEAQIPADLNRLISVTTDATDPEQLRAIFDDVRAKHRDDGDSWFVIIDCTSAPTRGDRPTARLANGKFANTQKGMVQVGLPSIDDVEFEPIGRTDCPPPE